MSGVAGVPWFVAGSAAAVLLLAAATGLAHAIVWRERRRRERAMLDLDGWDQSLSLWREEHARRQS